MTNQAAEQVEFLSDVLSGLRATPKTLSCKYLYDEKGSLLFEKICELDEYYVTRSELELMNAHIDEIIENIGTQCRLVEFGSGSSLKTSLILEHLQSPSIYLPVDISEEMLMQTAERFRLEYPELIVHPVCADFTQAFEIPPVEEPLSAKRMPTIVYFPGSTIGNLEPDHAVVLLRQIRNMIENEGGLFIGYDLQKDRSILEAAYDDSLGITAAFNKNILERMNKELGANFDLSQFEHCAKYNTNYDRLEMHLVSLVDQIVNLGKHSIKFAQNETIHTENSHKYTVEGFTEIAIQAGLQLVESWYDSKRYFTVQYLKAGDI